MTFAMHPTLHPACRCPCRRRWRSTRCMLRSLTALTFATLFLFSFSFDMLPGFSFLTETGYRWTYVGDPVPPEHLSECFSHIVGNFTSINASSSRETAAVVALTSLLGLAEREGISLGAATSGALNGVLEGGASHIILVPGGPASAWLAEAIEEVRMAVATAVDQHGVALPATFNAVTPSAVLCMGVGDVGAGVALGAALGAVSVLHLAAVSMLTRMSLRFPTGSPRFLPQINTSTSDDGETTTLPPLRKHFQSCGGELERQRCDPLPDALYLCSAWVRPVVQYGLCHPAGAFSPGRHTTAAANSPASPSLYSGYRLLEEVAPVTLPRGSLAAMSGLVADAAFPEPGAPFAYNRLADRSVGWLLVDSSTGGAGAQAVVELVLGLLGANITLLAPGRMCNLSFAGEGRPPHYAPPVSAADKEGDAKGGDAKSAEPVVSLVTGVAAARAALADLEGALREARVPIGLVVDAVDRAGAAVVATKAWSEGEFAALARWMRVYAWALHLQDKERAAGKAMNAQNVTTPSRPGDPLPPVTLASLEPRARPSLHHCYADHHNVRDILLVVNFNDWGTIWGSANMHHIISLYGSAFPSIIAYTSREGQPDIQQGLPSINLFYCPGGDGNTPGLRAEMCTGLAMTGFSGHIGYLVINDDAFISPWNMLAYRTDWQWHKPHKGYEWYYTCLEDKEEQKRRAESGKYTAGGWCYNCWSWYGAYGPPSIGKIHKRLPQWMIDVKTKNLGREDGVACSMVDVFYVPGVLAPSFGWLALLMARTGTSVELSQATIWDMVSLRSEHEHTRNVFRGGHGNAELTYNYTLHDWGHKMPFSRNTTLNLVRNLTARAAEEHRFYQPNIEQLRQRIFVSL